MKRFMLLFFALCGLLWPVAGHSQDPVRTPATDPNLKSRTQYGYSRDSFTLFLDWSTVYAKPEGESPLETGAPAVSYSFYLYDRVLSEDVSITSSSSGRVTDFYVSYDAQVRRDTLWYHGENIANIVNADRELSGVFTAVFSDNSIQPNSNNLPHPLIPRAHVALSVDPTFVREDAGATTIEIKAQFYRSLLLQEVGGLVDQIYISPAIERIFQLRSGLNILFYLDAPKFVIDLNSYENSATGQMTLTPIPHEEPIYREHQFENAQDLAIRIGAQDDFFSYQPAIIRLFDTDRPTTEIELTVSDPIISTGDRATEVTVTGTLNGALLDESVSFSLAVMPPTTAERDIDYDIRLARLTIPAGQATGTATVRVTPNNKNGGQIWLGVASHPTIGTGEDERIIVVKEVPIELIRQPGGLIAAVEPSLDIFREDAGQVNVDLKVVLEDALPVDETVWFSIVQTCDDSIAPCIDAGEDLDAAERGTDYFAELPPLTIPAGQKEATATLSLEPVDNSNINGFRYIRLVASLGNSRRVAAFIIILDDETATDFILLSASSTEIAEDSGQTTIEITGALTGSVLSESLTIALGLHEGFSTATRDLDYTVDFEPLTIPAGQITGTTTLTITPTPNDGQEQDEVITITSVADIKITEDGQEREIGVSRLEITLKDAVGQPAGTTPTDPATPTPAALAFDPPASTVIPGTVGQALVAVLPTATNDPEGALTYRVFNLPAGLTFDATTRTITGTPTTAGQTSIEYYAIGADATPAVLTYTIDIQEKPVLIVELYDIAASLLSIREDAGEAVAVTLTISLKENAKEDALIALAIIPPMLGKTAKLDEDFTATLPATITIPKGRRMGTAEITLLPNNNTTADGNKALAVQATSSSGHRALINIQIIDDETASDTASADEDSAPPAATDEDGGEASEGSFAFASAVDDQAYTEGTEIIALVLPEATGGEGAITYRVFNLPAGLVFDAATRIISGTPTATAGAVEVTYLAQDSAGTGITLAFSITVNPALSFGAGKANPAAFALADNFPNPFNPTTTIQYVLPQAADVQLTVYNLIGQSVRALVAKHQLPGRYVVEWDATDDGGQPVAAGVYFYRLKAGETFRQVKRMVLLK